MVPCRCVKAESLRGAAQPVTRWACGRCSWLRNVEQSVQDDGGQPGSVTELCTPTRWRIWTDDATEAPGKQDHIGPVKATEGARER